MLAKQDEDEVSGEALPAVHEGYDEDYDAYDEYDDPYLVSSDVEQDDYDESGIVSADVHVAGQLATAMDAALCVDPTTAIIEAQFRSLGLHHTVPKIDNLRQQQAHTIEGMHKVERNLADKFAALEHRCSSAFLEQAEVFKSFEVGLEQLGLFKSAELELE